MREKKKKTQLRMGPSIWTYTMLARSSGFSGCSGKMGCGGSLVGTHPKDLLMAWLSFFAGDFCGRGEKGRQEVKSSNQQERMDFRRTW